MCWTSRGLLVVEWAIGFAGFFVWILRGLQRGAAHGGRERERERERERTGVEGWAETVRMGRGGVQVCWKEGRMHPRGERRKREERGVCGGGTIELL